MLALYAHILLHNRSERHFIFHYCKTGDYNPKSAITCSVISTELEYHKIAFAC